MMADIFNIFFSSICIDFLFLFITKTSDLVDFQRFCRFFMLIDMINFFVISFMMFLNVHDGMYTLFMRKTIEEGRVLEDHDGKISF